MWELSDNLTQRGHGLQIEAPITNFLQRKRRFTKLKAEIAPFFSQNVM